MKFSFCVFKNFEIGFKNSYFSVKNLQKKKLTVTKRERFLVYHEEGYLKVQISKKKK